MRFEFYVLNYNFNEHRIENFNIFNNIRVQENSERAVKKYLRSPKNYKYQSLWNQEPVYGFEAFCKEIDTIIMCEEWSRIEYEISVANAFEDDINQLEKWDCYMQAKPNIKFIAYEIIRQYKEQLKESKLN